MGRIIMKRLIAIAAGVLIAGIAAFGSTPTDAAKKSSGWVTLFDGKNLDKWQGDDSASFQIVNGTVMAVDKKDPKAVASYLATKDNYKDFELTAEFWVSNDANSGIFIRCQDGMHVSG